MNNDDGELELFFGMVNDHHEEIRSRSLTNSLDKTPVEYTEKKKVSLVQLRNALLAVLGVLIILGASIKTVDAFTGNNLVDWYTISTRGVRYSVDKEIDSKIKEYEEMMGIKGPADKQIEIFVSRNLLDSQDPKVEYNNTNFYNDIIEASRTEDPVTEVRCALIASYRVINEPYLGKMFDALFKNLKENEEFANNTGFDMSGNIWTMLGYKDMDDFMLHAREDTKIYKTTISTRSSNGKGM